MSPTTSNSERGGYFSSFMFSYVNYPCVTPNSDVSFFVCVSSRWQRRVLEIEWAVKNGKEFVPSPKKPRKPRGKKRKVGTINLNHGWSREEGSSMSTGQHTMSFSSFDEGDEVEVETSLLGRIKEEEYEATGGAVETPALKRVKSEVE